MSFADIIPYYSTLVLTYGASLSNPLNAVPGSSSSSDPLAGVYPALALVSWYNSHPAYADLPVNLEKIKQVSVVGQGNVALDVARMLLKPVISLAGTDLSEEVLNVLSKSSVEKVRVVGRRGPGQVAFTTKEFREMLSIPDVGYAGVDPFLMEYAKENIEKGNGERMRKRLLQLMGTTRDGRKMFELDFLKGPKSFLPSTENARQVSEVEWNLNLLEKRPAIESQPTSIVARSTGETVRTSADMVIESVGYRSEPLTGPGHEWDLPFDIARGRVSNFNGRVTAEEGGFVSLVSFLLRLLLQKKRDFALMRMTKTGTRSLRCWLGCPRSCRCHRHHHERRLRTRFHHPRRHLRAYIIFPRCLHAQLSALCWYPRKGPKCSQGWKGCS